MQQHSRIRLQDSGTRTRRRRSGGWHLRIKAVRKLGINEVPEILCDEWTPAQVRSFRLLVNRSVTWADWDEELLSLELQELNVLDFDPATAKPSAQMAKNMMLRGVDPIGTLPALRLEGLYLVAGLALAQQ